jgi:hypothetical protein
MIKKTIFFFLIAFTVTSTAFAQEFYRRDFKYVDTATFMIWASPNFSVQFPFGTGYLASTFNFNYNIGFDFTIKTKSNWTFDAGFNYMFGSKVRKQVPEILGDMAFLHNINDKEQIAVIFNGAGNNSVTLGYEGRYWYVGASIGKIFPVNRWKNSGLWLKAGAGYFGHKIHFIDPNHYFPQIDQDTYRKGYDQRSSGIALNQFFGYMFMQRKRVLSFYAGIELWQIFTKPDRGYIFVGEFAGPTDNLRRQFSGLLGIKVGWILPFYEKKRVTTFYTY